MADRKVFSLWEADCERYVKMKEHGGWHLWHEIQFRLEQEFGLSFTTVPYNTHGDWLAVFWIYPKNTPRSRDDWMNQAKLKFMRSVERKTIFFGMEIEHIPQDWLEGEKLTADRDSHRLQSLVQHDTTFMQMIADLERNGLQVSAGYWDEKHEKATSSAELVEALSSLDKNRGWSMFIGSQLSCEDAVQLGEQIGERIMEVYRLVWPVWLRVLPEDVRAAMEEKAPSQPKPRNVVKESPPVEPIPAFAAYLSAHNFYFPHDLLTTYYLSLQTKPFVILTGISGTGKTKLAQFFAEWMSPEALAFIAVRPDWTDNRGLLGFYNLLTGKYQTSKLLRLLIQATLEGDRPHFVILDEMNLAKVEYYFADFLSVLESRYLQGEQLKQEKLRLHDLPRCVLAQGHQPWDEAPDQDTTDEHLCRVRCGECPLRAGLEETQRLRGESEYADARKAGFDPRQYIPPQMCIPHNVYFSGTVNVDETTYMFSPKVLDRANTIEFNAVDLAQYFAEPAASAAQTTPATDAIRAAFTFGGEFTRLPKTQPLRSASALARYREHLHDLNARLEPFTLHFGYRVADEILLYLWHAQQLDDPDFKLDVAFDHQIYQKILPKFHGSQAKLDAPLDVLREFCKSHSYEHSLAKIRHMIEALRKEGFTSFA